MKRIRIHSQAQREINEAFRWNLMKRIWRRLDLIRIERENDWTN